MKRMHRSGPGRSRRGVGLFVALALVPGACSDRAESPLAVQAVGNPNGDEGGVAAASIAIVSGDRQRGRAGQELAEPLVVRVTDAQGAPLPGVAVRWSVDWPWGVLGPHRGLCPEDGDIIGHRVQVTVSTDAEGLSRMSFVPTSFSLSAVHAELVEFADARVWFAVDTRDAGAAVEIVSGKEREASAGPTFEGEPLVVRVRDGQGTPVPNATILWGVPSGDVVLDACSRTVIDWSVEEEAFVTWGFWALRTGTDGTAAVGFRPRALGTSEVTARVPVMTDGVTFSIEATALVVGLSRDPSAGGMPTFQSPHLSADAGVPVGGVVEFRNSESTARIVSTSSPAGAASFDSGLLQRDGRFRFAPEVGGTWEFVDQVSGATGTLTARSADAGRGTVLVSNVTTGGAFDPDGYRVTIRTPGHPPRSAVLELNTGIQVPHVAAGPATVEIEDLADNCSVNGSRTRSVTVARNAEVPVEFAVACASPAELAAVGLVFARDGDLWTMNADGTELRQLTSGPATDMWPIVSPDGSRIAFTRALPDGGNRARVHVLDRGSGLITRLADDGPNDFAQAWSPDSRRIATQTGWFGGRIDVIGMDGTRRTLLNGSGGTGNGHNPAWSPDGRTIAFYRFDDATREYAVWSMDAEGRNQRFLTGLGDESWDAARRLYWSSGGNEILFTRREPGGHWEHGLWRMRADGAEAVRLLGLAPFGIPDFGDWGALSPDGKLLIMNRRWYPAGWESPLRADIYLVNLEDGSVVRVTADGQSFGADFLPPGPPGWRGNPQPTSAP